MDTGYRMCNYHNKHGYIKAQKGSKSQKSQWFFWSPHTVPRVGFENERYEFPEPDVDEFREIPLILEVLSERTLSVIVSLVNGVGEASAQDFSFQTQTITFQPLERSKNVSFTILSDDIPENLEDFTLVKGSNINNGTFPTTTIVITDTDGEQG